MLVTWSLLELTDPAVACPWAPPGASWSQAGHAAGPTAAVPGFDGRWWSVLSTFDDGAEDAAQQEPDVGAGLAAAWHVVLQPVAYHGDALLADGARPFDGLPARGKVEGAAAVVTMAGLGDDPERSGEFFERFAPLGQAVRSADGARAALVQAPDDGAVLTFSAWRTLRDAVTWAYHRPEHAATVARHAEHRLLDRSGFLRCAVLASSGTLAGRDPMAGLTGRPAPTTRETR